MVVGLAEGFHSLALEGGAESPVFVGLGPGVQPLGLESAVAARVLVGLLEGSQSSAWRLGQCPTWRWA